MHLAGPGPFNGPYADVYGEVLKAARWEGMMLCFYSVGHL